MSKKYTLSIVILSYNTKDLLKNCLDSLEKVKDEVSFEIIIPDSGSIDKSAEMVEKHFPDAKLIRIGKNLGFAAGNNKAKKYCTGKYVLFLNSDTVIYKDTLKKSVDYLNENLKVGALTCKILLPDGKLDKDARRSFITPWIGLTHLFLRLDRIFPRSSVFAKYWYGYISPGKTHQVDALQGAYFLVRKKLLDQLNWFDEDYFLDGEDIDLSWRIRQKEWNIIYYPKVTITHFKGSSKGKIKNQRKGNIPFKDRLRFRMAGVNSMEIFYKKHLWKRYPIFLNLLVLLGIKLIKLERFIKTLILG